MGTKPAVRSQPNVKVEPELHRRLKVAASRRAIKLGEFVDEALRAYLRTGGKDKPQNGQQVS
jgi:predicted HicB family RNase H-like nuclease